MTSTIDAFLPLEARGEDRGADGYETSDVVAQGRPASHFPASSSAGPCRVAIYARGDTGEAGDMGLQRQHENCARYAEQFDCGGEPVVFADQDASGRCISGRPSLEALLSAVRKGMIDVVIVSDLTRLSRDLLLLFVILTDLKAHGARLHVVDAGEVDVRRVCCDSLLASAARRRPSSWQRPWRRHRR